MIEGVAPLKVPAAALSLRIALLKALGILTSDL
jgi:hypothetical protein